MRRIAGTWPYLLVVALGYAVFWVMLLGCSGCSEAEVAGGGCALTSLEFKSLVISYLYGVVPVAAFATGAVLGYRRGYDAVAVVASLTLMLVIPDLVTGVDRTWFSWEVGKVFPVLAIAVVGHLGILAGIGLARLLSRRARAAGDPGRAAV